MKKLYVLIALFCFANQHMLGALSETEIFNKQLEFQELINHLFNPNDANNVKTYIEEFTKKLDAIKEKADLETIFHKLFTLGGSTTLIVDAYKTGNQEMIDALKAKGIVLKLDDLNEVSNTLIGLASRISSTDNLTKRKFIEDTITEVLNNPSLKRKSPIDEDFDHFIARLNAMLEKESNNETLLEAFDKRLQETKHKLDFNNVSIFDYFVKELTRTQGGVSEAKQKNILRQFKKITDQKLRDEILKKKDWIIQG